MPLLSVFAGSAFAAESQILLKRAHAVLVAALAHEKGFVKVHAAEALIALGEKDGPRRVFRAELPDGNEVRPYRIGVWRVLAASSPSAADRAEWIARTEAVVLDRTTMDRLHAVESLGKLAHAPTAEAVLAAVRAMARETEAAAVFPRWVLHLAGEREALPAIVAALDSSDPIARLRAAYVLRWLRISDPATRTAVARTAGREPSTEIGYPIIIGAAVALEADPARTAAWVAVLREIVAGGAAGARYDACQTLMRRETSTDPAPFAALLDSPEGDTRIGAAWAILHIAGRAKPASSAP